MALKEKVWNLLYPKPKFIAHTDIPTIEALKEKHCYVALDIKQAKASIEDFSVPTKTDYSGVSLEAERFEIPEMLFSETVFGSIMAYITKFLRIFDVPVILCGGSSLFPGLYRTNTLNRRLRRFQLP